MQDERLQKLTTLVTERLELENKKKTETPEYQINKEKFETFMEGLSNVDAMYLRNLFDQQYKNILNLLRSELGDNKSLEEKLNKDAEIYYQCFSLLSQKLFRPQNKIANKKVLTQSQSKTRELGK